MSFVRSDLCKCGKTREKKACDKADKKPFSEYLGLQSDAQEFNDFQIVMCMDENRICMPAAWRKLSKIEVCRHGGLYSSSSH